MITKKEVLTRQNRVKKMPVTLKESDKNFIAPNKDLSLNINEVKKLHNYDFSKNEMLDKARDLFILGCVTGMRFSDYSQIKRCEIKNNHFLIKNQKTGVILEIPLTKYSKAIITKWGNNLPSITIQKFNLLIKEACNIAGIEGNKISSFTARRTFIEIGYNNGMPTNILMKVTGYENYNPFAITLKVNKVHVQNEMFRIFGNA